MNGTGVFYVVWIGLAVAIGYYASTKKNHNGVVWFLLALVFSPLIVGIIALLMGPKSPRPTWSAPSPRSRVRSRPPSACRPRASRPGPGRILRDR